MKTKKRKNETILIVEDDLITRELLSSFLTPSYNVMIMDNGIEFMDKVEEIKPDLILLDVNLPKMDGFEIAKKLKLNIRTNQIPIIFVTAKRETENIVKGFEAGGCDYITKPFIATELKVRIKTHLKVKKYHDQLLSLIQDYSERLSKTQLLLKENGTH